MENRANLKTTNYLEEIRNENFRCPRCQLKINVPFVLWVLNLWIFLQFQIDLCSQLLGEKSVKLVRVGMM